MKRLVDVYTSMINRDPIPSAPPTPLIRSTTPPGSFRPPSRMLPLLSTVSMLNDKGEIVAMKITAAIIERTIDKIEADPTAGLGLFSKRQLLVDELLRIFNTAEQSDAVGKNAAPLLSEPRKVAAQTPRPQSQPQPRETERVEARANISIGPGGQRSVSATAKPVESENA